MKQPAPRTRASDGPGSDLDCPGRRLRRKAAALTCRLPDVCDPRPHPPSPVPIAAVPKTDPDARGRPWRAGLGGTGRHRQAPLGGGGPGVRWLHPIPDTLITAGSADPADIVASRQSIRLALIAALQYLPARQRAVLILHDVLRWRAAEVAELLGVSTAPRNRLLQRARARPQPAAPPQ